MAAAIEVKNVVKSFQDTTVLHDVSVSFAPGQIHGLIGRNGSGKTVLMKCICGFMRPTSGEILVEGKRVAQGRRYSAEYGRHHRGAGLSDRVLGL